jgi:hypothetical protein
LLFLDYLRRQVAHFRLPMPDGRFWLGGHALSGGWCCRWHRHLLPGGSGCEHDCKDDRNQTHRDLPRRSPIALPPRWFFINQSRQGSWVPRHSAFVVGSWKNDPRDLRAADRDWSTSDLRNNGYGFRLGRTLNLTAAGRLENCLSEGRPFYLCVNQVAADVFADFPADGRMPVGRLIGAPAHEHELTGRSRLVCLLSD